MKKYTDEQLSRILSCAAVGLLGPHGRFNNWHPAARDRACVEQAAFATWETDPLIIEREEHGDKKRARVYDRWLGNWSERGDSALQNVGAEEIVSFLQKNKMM